MVNGYRDERIRQEIAFENGGFRDEARRAQMITFRKWLRFYWRCVDA